MTEELCQFRRIVSIVMSLAERVHPDGCRWNVSRYSGLDGLLVTLPTMQHANCTRDMRMTVERAASMSEEEIVATFEEFMREGDNIRKDGAK